MFSDFMYQIQKNKNEINKWVNSSKKYIINISYSLTKENIAILALVMGLIIIIFCAPYIIIGILIILWISGSFQISRKND